MLNVSCTTPRDSECPSTRIHEEWSDAEDDQELEVIITRGPPSSDTDTQTSSLSYEPSEPEAFRAKGQFCCKLLVPSHYAGPILGRGGRNLLAVEKQTNTSIHISGAGVCFPGTEDRMLILFAETLSSLVDGMEMVVQQMRSCSERQKQHVVSKLVVPSSAVSKIIGRGGCHLQKLKESTGCRVSISPRNEGMQERVVLLGGDAPTRLNAAALILNCIQEDPHLHEHMHFDYNVELQRGCWDSCKSPQNQDVLLPPPHEVIDLPKRHLVELLREAAPRDVLIRNSLLGDVRKILKANPRDKLLAVHDEAWRSLQLPTAPSSRA